MNSPICNNFTYKFPIAFNSYRKVSMTRTSLNIPRCNNCWNWCFFLWEWNNIIKINRTFIFAMSFVSLFYNFIIWNFVLTYNCRFSPVSKAVLLYRHKIFNQDEMANANFENSFSTLFRQPIQHVLSLFFNFNKY